MLCSRRRAAQSLAKLAPPANGGYANKCVVLFVHHLSKRKGADLVPQIARNFLHEQVEFWMIGEGPEIEDLKIKIKDWKLEGNVKLLGQVPNAEIVKYFHAADVFLMPSREEGSPHVILEAMASGLPFVASDIGGIREIVPPELTDNLCKSEDADCFASKILLLLSDDDAWKKASDVSVVFSKNFDKDRGVKEFIALFK